MNFKMHLISGIVVSGGLVSAGLLLDYGMTPNDIKMIVPAVILGSLFPDLDTESYISKIYAVFLVVILVFLAYNKLLIFGLIFLAPYLAAKISKHRGWTHSYLLVVALFGLTQASAYLSGFIPGKYVWIVVMIVFYSLAMYSFAIGVMIHDFCDGRSPFKLKNWIKPERIGL